MLISLEEKAYIFSYIFCAILRPLRGQDHNKVFWVFFSVLLFLLVLRGHSVFSSPPQRPMTSDFERFSIPDILILEKEPVFSLLNFQC